MPANNTETDGESHARAGFAFRGEERIEQSLFDFGGHAGAGIGDAEHDAIARFLCGDTHFAARRHRVDGVVDHVYEHLAEFDRVAFDERLAIGMEREAYRREFG